MLSTSFRASGESGFQKGVGSKKRTPRTSVQKHKRTAEASAVTGNGITDTTTPQERDTDAPKGAKLFEEKGRGSAMEESDAGPCPSPGAAMAAEPSQGRLRTTFLNHADGMFAKPPRCAGKSRQQDAPLCGGNPRQPSGEGLILAAARFDLHPSTIRQRCRRYVAAAPCCPSVAGEPDRGMLFSTNALV